MAKNSISANKIRLLYYQWESLRANPQYVRDYALYQKRLLDPKANRRRLGYESEIFFQKRYGISPLNPAVPLPIKLSNLKKKAVTSQERLQLILWTYFVELRKSAYSLSPSLEDSIKARLQRKPKPSPPRRELSDVELKGKSSVIIAVNLNDSISDIVNDVKKIVRPLQERKVQLANKKAERNRPKTYESYFKTYKLRGKGLSWTEIAKKRYPDLFKKMLPTPEGR